MKRYATTLNIEETNSKPAIHFANLMTFFTIRSTKLRKRWLPNKKTSPCLCTYAHGKCAPKPWNWQLPVGAMEPTEHHGRQQPPRPWKTKQCLLHGKRHCFTMQNRLFCTARQTVLHSALAEQPQPYTQKELACFTAYEPRWTKNIIWIYTYEKLFTWSIQNVSFTFTSSSNKNNLLIIIMKKTYLPNHWIPILGFSACKGTHTWRNNL